MTEAPDPNSLAPIDEEAALRALSGLAHAQRLRVYRRLVGAGPGGLTPSVLAEELGLPASTLSFHLKELTHAGLASAQRSGRHLIYRPALARMQALMQYLTAHCCQQAGDPVMAALPSCGLAALPDCR
jgi:ArsR family transcriptional regulator, arsenate/arsenite/antimonite-responsive transcriptional repressor